MKEWRTFSGQAEYACKSKNIDVSDIEKMKIIFEKYNYTNIINPYKVNFYTDISSDGKLEHIYDEITKFDSYMELYYRDRLIIDLLQSICYDFETHLTTILVHIITREVCKDEFFWDKRINSIKNEVDKCMKNNLKNKKISDKQYKQFKNKKLKNNQRYYLKKLKDQKALIAYNNFCSLNKTNQLSKGEFFEKDCDYFFKIFLLSLGEKKALYQILTKKCQEDMIKIMKIPKMNKISEFNIFLEILRKVRNKINHLTNLAIIIDKEFIEYMKEKKHNNPEFVINVDTEYNYQRNSVFYFLKISSEYYSTLDSEILKYTTVDLDDINESRKHLINSFRKRSVKLLTYPNKYFSI